MSIQTPSRPEYMSISDAAEYINHSQRTVRRRISDGSLPAYRVGSKSIRVKREDLEALLQPVPTIATINGDNRVA